MSSLVEQQLQISAPPDKTCHIFPARLAAVWPLLSAGISECNHQTFCGCRKGAGKHYLNCRLLELAAYNDGLRLAVEEK